MAQSGNNMPKHLPFARRATANGNFSVPSQLELPTPSCPDDVFKVEVGTKLPVVSSAGPESSGLVFGGLMVKTGRNVQSPAVRPNWSVSRCSMGPKPRL